MKLYLAGPMRGYPLCNFPEFDRYAGRLRDMGHEVWSPAECDRALGFDPKEDDCLELWEYMLRDIPEVLKADAVAMMPSWEYSEGGVLEALVAHWCRKPILNADTLLPAAAHPSIVAFETVFDILRAGLGKHAPDTWRTEPVENHQLKAARHALTCAIRGSCYMDESLLAARDIITSVLTARGLQNGPYNPHEDEDHEGNAICRAVMAKACGDTVHKRRSS